MKRVVVILFTLSLLLGLALVPATSAEDDTAAMESIEQPAFDKAKEAPDDKIIAAASPASWTSELDYIRITPCRIVDTRVAGGNLAAFSGRSFQVKGTTGFEGQGGAAGGCGIPDGAAAVEFTFTAVNQAGTGWMRMQPWASIMPILPKATLLNYSTALNASNSAIVPVCTGSWCAYDLNVRNYGSSSGLLVDVTGYFAPELFAVVAADGTFVRGSGVTWAANLGTGTYSVGFDRNITRCVFTATRGETGMIGSPVPGTVGVAGRIGTNNGVWVAMTNLAGTPQNEDFHLRVDC